MGRHYHYKPGSFYRTDDRSGFPQRAERTKQEWTGLIVADDLWEERQPQDLVKGVVDDQTVPMARPLAPNVYVGPQYTTLSAAAVVGQTVIEIAATKGFFDGVPVGVMLDNGEFFNTTQVGNAGAGSITLAGGLPYTAASGNDVALRTQRIPDPPRP